MTQPVAEKIYLRVKPMPALMDLRLWAIKQMLDEVYKKSIPPLARAHLAKHLTGICGVLDHFGVVKFRIGKDPAAFGAQKPAFCITIEKTEASQIAKVILQKNPKLMVLPSLKDRNTVGIFLT